MRIGDKITGTISGIQSYGVFVKIDDEHQGLIHISELKHGFVADLDSQYKVGDKVKVVGNPDLDTTRECISVSYPNFVHDVAVGIHILLFGFRKASVRYSVDALQGRDDRRELAGTAGRSFRV